MQNENTEAITTLVTSIKEYVALITSKLNYDKTIRCKVVTVVGGGIYKVEKQKKQFNAKSLSGVTYAVNDFVLVLMPEGIIENSVIIGKIT